MGTLSLLLLSLALSHVGLSLPTEECPILGPVTPSGFDLSNFKPIRDAKSSFPAVIESLFSSDAINETHTSFAINVFSTATNQSLYSYYHAAEGLNGTLTTGELNDGTIFRIGSVSKLYTVYALLAKAGYDVLNHPVTDYLPELAGNSRSDPLEKIIWEGVTVGALASQQAGSGGVPLETSVFCYNTTEGCTTQDFLALMKDQKRPVTLPFQVPIYSDGGFAVLGVVLQRLTGLSYNDAIQSILAEPLGLNSSTTLEPKGKDVNGLIIPGSGAESNWGVDNQVIAPSGGVYSNGADLREIGLSILHSELLSAVETRRWMKPLGGTSSLTFSVGAPWEINRLTIPVTAGSNRTRVSDLYTKLGGNAGYAGVFALSPDHGIGYSILVAGPTAVSARIPLRDAVGTAFIIAAEHAGAENAERNFPGTFVDKSSKDSNLTLTFDEGHPGLGLKSWYVNGSEWRANLTLPGSDPAPLDDLTVRLYPIGARSSSGTIEHISFRAVPQFKPIEPRSEVEGGKGLFDNGCQTWESVGFFEFDEFVFNIVDGRLASIWSKFAERVFERVE